MKPKHAAVGGLALGLLIALTANLAYAIPRGPVVVGLGLVAPLVLPVVLHLRTTFTVSGFWAVSVREMSTLAVAGPAVAISYVHTYELILGAGELWLLAVLAPLSSDGLAGLATLALYRMRSTARTSAKPKPPRRAETVVPASKADPAVDPAVDELGSTRELVAQIMADEGCSQRTAYRRLAELRKEAEQAAS